MECERPARPPRPLGAQERSSTLSAEQCMERMRDLRDEAYLCIEQGLSCDEQGQAQQAYILYNKGLSAIAKAFQYVRNIPAQFKTGTKWDSVQKNLSKMEKTKLEIESRVSALKSNTDVVRSMTDPPPSYEMASSTSLEDDLQSIADELDQPDSADVANALEVYRIPDGVQIFHITPEGNVSAPSYPSPLGIFKFTDPNVRTQGAGNVAEAPPAFLKVGGWTYPLIPGASPAMHACWGAYVFPDIESDRGGSVGVIIPDSVSEQQKREFENVLNELTNLRIQESADDSLLEEVEEEREKVKEKGEEEGERTSEAVAKGIVTAAEWLAWGLGKGAEKAGELIKYSSNKLRDNLQPEAQPSVIDPRAQQGVHYTRKATGAAVKVSGYLVQKLGEGTMALGRKVAPHVRKRGEQYLPAAFSKQQGGRSRMDDVAEVAVGGIKGWATVYIGLEAAARSLAKNISDETVHVVSHKYGADAGVFAENTLYSAGNVGMAAYNYNNLGVKAIAKRAAKDTGKAVAQDYQQNKKAKQARGGDPGQGGS